MAEFSPTLPDPESHQQKRDSSESELQIDFLEREIRILEDRLERVENSLIFRLLRRAGGFTAVYRHRVGKIFMRSPLHSVYLRATSAPPVTRDYRRWIATRQQIDAEALHAEQGQWSYRPLISIVMATRNPNAAWLAAAIDSVRSQVYENWQLCISDDGSGPQVSSYLNELAQTDPRIRSTISTNHIGIAGALNRGMALAEGDYTAFLDHDDLLAPLALHSVVKLLQRTHPEIIYTDEDYIDAQGRPVRPNFKPGWSPLLLQSCMYLGHLLVVSSAALKDAGGFRSELDGAQDYDLALRLIDSGAEVQHIPEVLYHWRQHAESTAAAAAAKPYAHDAGRRALAGEMARKGCSAEVSNGSEPNRYEIRRAPEDRPISIVICSRTAPLLQRCLASLDANTSYRPLEIIVVQHITGEPGRDELVQQIIQTRHATAVNYSGKFNFALMNNLGARRTSGELLLFLNDDVEALESDWLARMAAHFIDRTVGIVGAKLLYPNGAIQHAGMVLGMAEGAGHPGRGLFASDYWKWLNFSREVSAVTGACLAISRELFERLGGFDPNFPVNYNDVDLCLRAREAGFRVILEAGAKLRHREAQTRPGLTTHEERRRFFLRWHRMLERGDPYYNPNLAAQSESIELIKI